MNNMNLQYLRNKIERLDRDVERTIVGQIRNAAPSLAANERDIITITHHGKTYTISFDTTMFITSIVHKEEPKEKPKSVTFDKEELLKTLKAFEEEYEAIYGAPTTKG